jgi:capsular polysaccharide biosynthesis protein
MTPYQAIVDDLGVEVRDVVVMPGRNAARMTRHYANLFPDATMHVLADRQAVPTSLARGPQPQLIVDSSGQSTTGKGALFKKTFGFLQAGGAYVVEADASNRARLVEIATERGDVQVLSNLVVVRQRLEERYKIREADANELLDARFGSQWGRVLTVQPPVSYVSHAEVTVHGTRESWQGVLTEPRSHGTIDVPDLYVRQYSDVTCWGQQRVALANYWLPDTYRHPLHHKLTHRSLLNSGQGHAHLPPDATRSARPIEGPCFYFDSEYPAHFGHFLTEVLSRVWGWQEAVRAQPDIRPLIGMARGRETIPTYQRQILEALAVNLSNAAYVAADECVLVESLYAATPAFAMPHYASPSLRETWSSVARRFVRRDADTPRRLFIARRVRNIRSCLNTEEVEAFFADLGFAVVYPEDHDFAEQLTLFANADVIAGFAGSGLFNIMFAGEKPVIVIGADTYTATNEYLIASLTGARLYYFLGEAEIEHSPKGWRWAAFQANFRFDVRRYGPDITDIVHR